VHRSNHKGVAIRRHTNGRDMGAKRTALTTLVITAGAVLSHGCSGDDAYLLLLVNFLSNAVVTTIGQLLFV
jgi:hypothetical protein